MSEEKSGIKDPYKKYKEFKWSNPDVFKNGPLSDENRKCRDILCCLFFIIFLIACVVVAVLGFKNGDPSLILYPYDEDGNECGRNETKDHAFAGGGRFAGSLHRGGLGRRSAPRQHAR